MLGSDGREQRSERGPRGNLPRLAPVSGLNRIQESRDLPRRISNLLRAESERGQLANHPLWKRGQHQHILWSGQASGDFSRAANHARAHALRQHTLYVHRGRLHGLMNVLRVSGYPESGTAET
jgi:hypothetical protein